MNREEFYKKLCLGKFTEQELESIYNEELLIDGVEIEEIDETEEESVDGNYYCQKVFSIDGVLYGFSMRFNDEWQEEFFEKQPYEVRKKTRHITVFEPVDW